jgi:hypothetical protein
VLLSGRESCANKEKNLTVFDNPRAPEDIKRITKAAKTLVSYFEKDFIFLFSKE